MKLLFTVDENTFGNYDYYDDGTFASRTRGRPDDSAVRWRVEGGKVRRQTLEYGWVEDTWKTQEAYRAYIAKLVLEE